MSFEYHLLQVVFEGVIGNGYQGDIAIDDISVMNGKCSSPGKFHIGYT